MTGLLIAVGIWMLLVAVWAYALCGAAARGDRMARDRGRFHDDGPRHTPGGWRL